MMPLTRTDRLGSLDILRWLAAVAVVAFHAGNVVSLVDGKPFGGKLALGYHGVDLFFVLSGFVICNAHFQELGMPQALPGYSLKRFLRIYPAYWLALTAAVAVQVTFPFHEPVTAPSLLRHALLIPSQAVDYPWVVPAWTLHYELLFYLVFGLCIVLPRKLGIALLLAWPTCIAVLALSGIQLAFPLSFLTSSLVLYFMAGVAAALAYRHLPPVLAGLALMSGLVVWIVPAALSWPFNLVRVQAYAPAAAFIIMGAAALERRLGSIRSWVTDYLGALTFSTYLIHYTVFALLLTSGLFKRYRTGSPEMDALILLVLGLAAGAAFYSWLEQPLITRLRAFLWNKRTADSKRSHVVGGAIVDGRAI